jgi:hypothetical protein
MTHRQTTADKSAKQPALRRSSIVAKGISVLHCRISRGPTRDALISPEHRSLLSVQVLRAIAATSVVICHIVGYALLLAVALGAAVLVHILFEKPVTRILQRRIAIMFHGERGKASASDLKSLGDQRTNM